MPNPASAPLPALPSAASRHIPALDGIRGIAVVAVLFAHTGLLPFGAAGVDVFFVLSGYLITSLLVTELQLTGRLGFKNFYIRRWLRLAPALFLLVALTLPFARWIGMPMSRAAGDSAIALFYASNWTRAYLHRPSLLGHTWSLAIEEQFYILWPLIVWVLYTALRLRRAAVACLSAAIAVIFYRDWLLQLGATPERIYNGLDTRADTLLAGAVLGFWMPRIPRAWAIALGTLSTAALIAYMAGANPFYFAVKPLGVVLQYHSYVVPVVCTVGILIGILNAGASPLARLFALSPLVWLGKISYGLYLFHYPLMGYLLGLGVGSWQIALIGIPVTFAIAVPSYYLLERPCLRLKDRFRTPLSPALAVENRAARTPAALNDHLSSPLETSLEAGARYSTPH